MVLESILITSIVEAIKNREKFMGVTFHGYVSEAINDVCKEYPKLSTSTMISFFEDDEVLNQIILQKTEGKKPNVSNLSKLFLKYLPDKYHERSEDILIFLLNLLERRLIKNKELEAKIHLNYFQTFESSLNNLQQCPQQLQEIIEILKKNEHIKPDSNYTVYSGHKFSISVPKNWDIFTDKDKKIKELQMDAKTEPFGHMLTKPVLLLTPSSGERVHTIMIGMGDDVPDSIELLTYRLLKPALKVGLSEIIDIHVDSILNMATIGILTENNDEKIYLVQKWFKKGNRAYIIILPHLEKSNVKYDEKLVLQLKEIVQSFKIDPD